MHRLSSFLWLPSESVSETDTEARKTEQNNKINKGSLALIAMVAKQNKTVKRDI